VKYKKNGKNWQLETKCIARKATQKRQDRNRTTDGRNTAHCSRFRQLHLHSTR